MRNRFLVILLLFVVFASSSCIKDTSCDPKTPQSEAAAMQTYATAQGITATVDASSGLFYEIISPGNSTKPTVNSRIFIRYTGKLLDGTVFDQQADHTQTGWFLGGLIPGWQLGLQLIGEGGQIKLIIPSSLAYGCRDNGPIPGNSVLFFDVQLIDVQ
jgi:FKBP-type peptidyl-prolyl cis-trans isomerase FkpA